MKFTVEVRKSEPYVLHRYDELRDEWASLEIRPPISDLGDGFGSCLPSSAKGWKWIFSGDGYTLVMVDIPVGRAQHVAWELARNLSELTGTNWDDELDKIIDQLWDEFPSAAENSGLGDLRTSLHWLVEWVSMSKNPVAHEGKLAGAIDIAYPNQWDSEMLHEALTDQRSLEKEQPHRARYISSMVYSSFVHPRRLSA